MTKDSIIHRLLAEKHSEDVFIPQCKNGPTSEGLIQLDYWAMPKTWAKWSSVGYEIKVSRSDFLRDKKWMSYLDYCNEFYWVAPPGVIKEGEISNDCGLMELSKNSVRLLTKKKAVWRKVEIPEKFYRYILMARVEKIGHTFNAHETKEQYWKFWLENKESKLNVGHQASKKIRKMIATKITEVETKQNLLEKRLEGYAAIEALCVKMGLSVDGYWVEDQFRRRVEQLQGLKSSNLVRAANSLKRDLEFFLKAVEEEK